MFDQVSGPPVVGFDRWRIRLRSVALISMTDQIIYYVYAIYSPKLDLVYIGQTSNLEKRISDHIKGYSKYTSRTDDWILIYSEECQSRAGAMRRERQLKSCKGREFIKSRIEKYV